MTRICKPFGKAIVDEKEVYRIDAVPSKRLFLSIIADYDLNRLICELIDNALERARPYELELTLSVVITVAKQASYDAKRQI